MTAASNFLDSEAKKYPDLKERYVSFKSNYENKLWHQLTLEISDFLLDKSCKKGQNFIDLYQSFIVTFEKNLAPLRLVQACTVISRQYFEEKVTADSVEQALEFMKALMAKDKNLNFDAACRVVAETCMAEICLSHPESDIFVPRCRETLLKVETGELTQLKRNADVAKSAFFRVSSEMYKIIGPSEKFYHSALQFLAHTPVDALDQEKRAQLAQDVCVAALVAEDVFNFGEIVTQPILQSMPNGRQWLLELLQAFNEGDIESFSRIFKTQEHDFQEIKILAANVDILKQKIGVMALLKLIFHRMSKARVIDLDEIAREVRLESKMTEWLIMRAMAKKLVRGKIDAVNRTLTVEWLKPRVLTLDQVGSLQEKLELWKQKVDSSLDFLSNEAGEMFN